MKNLPVNLKTFGFIEREFVNGERVKNKCGRDFLYYSLHYYFPNKFNRDINSPILIDRNKVFGVPVNAKFAWIQIQFLKVPALMKKLGLSLYINDKPINTFLDFVTSTSIINPNRKSVKEAIMEVEKAVDAGLAVGIDVSMGLGGLLDHVLFVYGYDENNLYVFDTYQIAALEYEKITDDNRYIMKLSKNIVKKRWSKFGRVWIIKK